jgi:hypothetical protein
VLNGIAQTQGNVNEKAVSFYSRKHQAVVMADVLKKVLAECQKDRQKK